MTNREVEQIKKQYEQKDNTKLDQLKGLDKKAKLPSSIFTYTFGILGALVLGFGMCICLGAILKDYFVLGIIIGIIGLVMVGLNPIFTKKIWKKSQEKYGPEIIKLSEEIMKNK